MPRIEGTREVRELLGGIAARLRDPSPAVRAEADAMHDAGVRSIETRTRPDGSAWPPRKAATARPGRRGRARSSGRASGRLASSGKVTEADGDAVLEFTAPYAEPVQESGREFVPFDGAEPQDEGSLEGIEDRLADFIVEGAR